MIEIGTHRYGTAHHCVHCRTELPGPSAGRNPNCGMPDCLQRAELAADEARAKRDGDL